MITEKFESPASPKSLFEIRYYIDVGNDSPSGDLLNTVDGDRRTEQSMQADWNTIRINTKSINSSL